MPILAEAIDGSTSVSLGLMLSVGGLLFGALTTALIARVTHGLAIKHLREDFAEMNEEFKECQREVSALKTWRHTTEAVDQALKSHQSTSRGTQPYPKGRR